MLKERTAQGAPDTPELRNAIREELNTRELLAREAKKANLDKQADIKQQMDLAGQTVLVRAYVTDWIKKNPVPDAELRKEYDAIKAQMGDKEYKVKHILVEKEDEAKAIVAQLKAGAKFEDLAKKSSKDPGSAPNGGDLDFAAPGSYVPEFSQAMTALKKGEYTETPVKTQFGYHIIKLEDTRAAQFPPLADVKPQIQQRLAQQKAATFRDELRAKAKTDYKFTN
jgi:peptidyl-prolyl cis-trans isomerase C